jgi:hypothetical protein
MATALHVVVVGGRAVGLFTSFLIARAGHTIVVVEQESRQTASAVESAAKSAFRSTVPHIVQPHAVMARCRELLIETSARHLRPATDGRGVRGASFDPDVGIAAGYRLPAGRRTVNVLDEPARNDRLGTPTRDVHGGTSDDAPGTAGYWFALPNAAKHRM